jgi:hypothetical protein
VIFLSKKRCIKKKFIPKRKVEVTEAAAMLKESYGVNTIKPPVIYNRLKRFQGGTENEWKMKLLRIDILLCRPIRTFYVFENLYYQIGESLSG